MERAFSAFVIFVGTVGSIVGFFPVFSSNKLLHNIIPVATLSGITIIVIVFLFYREIAHSKHRAIASTAKDQQKASEILRDVSTYLDNLLEKHRSDPPSVAKTDLAQCRELLEQVVDKYATIFSLTTTRRCRMCIKTIFEESDVLYVFALARDEMAARENRHDDENRLKTRHDRLQDNSDFLSLWDPKTADEGYFISDNVNKEREYKSSSISYWRNVKSDPNRPTQQDSATLSYKSVIVWPIRQDRRDAIGVTQDKCVGFLAIDSESESAFDKRWDAPLGKILANNLYPVLERYAELDRLIVSSAESHRPGDTLVDKEEAEKDV